MHPLRTLTCLVAITFTSAVTLRPALAQTSAPQTSASQNGSSQAILNVLNKSVRDWNRGDLNAFATSYKNSPGILFIGRTIQHGYAEMLARYKNIYPTREKMGTLSFSQLETQPLDEHFATVTGHFHLQRTLAGGGNADGYFLLVMERTPEGWKIVRDDTVSSTS
jgi:ketosteroid isomerase-like protein